jgi:hypothetical protein
VRQGTRAAWVALLLVAGLLAGAASAPAQEDLSAALIGTWEGEQEYLTVRSEDPKRTLVIESVSQVDGKWIANGRYTAPNGTGRVNIAIDTSARYPSLSWTSPSGAQYQLNLLKDRQLVGKITFTTGQGKIGSAGSRERGLKLEKMK